MRDFNHFAIPGWFLNGKILKRRNFSRVQLKVFNMLVPVRAAARSADPGQGPGDHRRGAQGLRLPAPDRVEHLAQQQELRPPLPPLDQDGGVLDLPDVAHPRVSPDP